MTTIRRHSFSSWDSTKWHFDAKSGTVTTSEFAFACRNPSSKIRIARRPNWNSSTKLNKMNTSQSSIESNISPSESSLTKPSDAANKVDQSLNGVDDLTGIRIYNLWNDCLTTEKIPSVVAWSRCRRLAYDALDVFSERVSALEKVLQDDVARLQSLDLSTVLEKKNEIEAAVFELEDLDIEMKQVSKAFQTVAQCLPECAERARTKTTIKEARKRYFDLLDNLARKKELFRSLDPLLREYKELGSMVKNWLDATEARTELFIRDFNNEELMLDNEECIETVYAELCTQKDPYENFLEAGESLQDLNSTEDLTELAQDLKDVTSRWDALCSNLEKCLNRLEVAKKIALNSKKKDTEKIERQIRSEERRCTCHSPFQIIKYGEGKYKFGNSKIVRLVRIHGSSIVVRVGGGWEFLYEFLLKVDPCRAKQLAENKGMSTLNLSGLDLTPVDKKASEFTFTVRRMSQSSWTPHYRTRPHSVNGSLDSTTSSDNGGDESIDSGGGFSICADPCTPKSSRIVPLRRRSQVTTGGKSHENLTKRLSLIERQADYAEKLKMKKLSGEK